MFGKHVMIAQLLLLCCIIVRSCQSYILPDFHDSHILEIEKQKDYENKYPIIYNLELAAPEIGSLRTKESDENLNDQRMSTTKTVLLQHEIVTQMDTGNSDGDQKQNYNQEKKNLKPSMEPYGFFRMSRLLGWVK